MYQANKDDLELLDRALDYCKMIYDEIDSYDYGYQLNKLRLHNAITAIAQVADDFEEKIKALIP